MMDINSLLGRIDQEVKGEVQARKAAWAEAARMIASALNDSSALMSPPGMLSNSSGLVSKPFSSASSPWSRQNPRFANIAGLSA